MAVLDHIEVIIRVAGNPALEYDDPDEDSNAPDSKIVTKYIEAISDAPFEFLFVAKKGYKFESRDLAFRVYVDGEWARGAIILSKGRKKLKYDEVKTQSTVKYERDGRLMESQFKFSDVVVGNVDAKSLASGENMYSNVGVLKVVVCREKLRYDAQAKGVYQFKLCGELSEKSTKGQAISHTVSLGPESAAKPHTNYARVVESSKVAVFEFKYRSRKALQDLMVIPRSPSPVPLEDRREEDLSTEEMLELIKQQKRELSMRKETERKLKRERIKTEFDNSNNIGPKRLRTHGHESDSDMEITVRERTIEVIDLLD